MAKKKRKKNPSAAPWLIGLGLVTVAGIGVVVYKRRQDKKAEDKPKLLSEMRVDCGSSVPPVFVVRTDAQGKAFVAKTKKTDGFVLNVQFRAATAQTRQEVLQALCDFLENFPPDIVALVGAFTGRPATPEEDLSGAVWIDALPEGDHVVEMKIFQGIENLQAAVSSALDVVDG